MSKSIRFLFHFKTALPCNISDWFSKDAIECLSLELLRPTQTNHAYALQHIYLTAKETHIIQYSLIPETLIKFYPN